jgi:hypothetical protein
MVKFDAQSIKERIIDRLKSKESWADVLFFSANQRLIDIFAEELAYDMQYDEILTREVKWSLARQTSSLMAETQFFNYYPHRKIGSNGLLQVSTSSTFNVQYPRSIQISKYDVFSTEAGTQFVCSETTNLTSSNNFVSVNVVQGIPKTELYTAVGETYEKFCVYNASIENTIFDIYVNGELWTPITHIREAEDDSAKVYVVQNLFNFSGVCISFGNDFFGRKLRPNDIVEFKYIETLGSDGNIESLNIINTVVSTFTDSAGDEVDLYCRNQEYIVGGLDYEELENIRNKAPKAYQTGNRAINKSDYKSIVESFSFTKKANVWGEAEVNEDLGNLPGTYIASEENVVHISAINSSDQSISSTQETQIREELNEKKSPTDIVVFEPVNFIYIYFTIAAYISDKKYSLQLVSDAIRSTIESDYSINSLDFNKPIRYSDYIAKIDGVEGVDYHETTISYYMLNSFTSQYVSELFIEMANVTPNTVSIYIAPISGSVYDLMAQDDGAGNIVGEAGYTTSGSIIDYNTGIGNLIVSSGLTLDFTLYKLRIEFSISSQNILPTRRYQIVSYGDSAITTSYI